MQEQLKPTGVWKEEVSDVGGGGGLRGQRAPGSSPLRVWAKDTEEVQACALPASELPWGRGQAQRTRAGLSTSEQE